MAARRHNAARWWRGVNERRKNERRPYDWGIPDFRVFTLAPDACARIEEDEYDSRR